MNKFFLIGAYVFISTSVLAQKKDWQNMDPQFDHVFGISTERAYHEFLKNRKPVSVIVAVIDSGIDTAHIDLKNSIWTNAREIPGNGIDDDHNGYIDDIHGWNFIGSETGKEDLVNLIRSNKSFYDSLSMTRVPQEYRAGYQSFRMLEHEYPSHVSNPQSYIEELTNAASLLKKIVARIGKVDPTLQDLKTFVTADKNERILIERVCNRMPLYPDFKAYQKTEIDDVLYALQYHIQHGLNLDSASSEANDTQMHNNGNVSNDIVGPVNTKTSVFHGTHIAGIIAADRYNGIGMNGVCDQVKIMCLRVISAVRELRDDNLAEAIRYAVDNGAKVINLSFGKPYSWNKTAVDNAIKYAMSKDVLFIHAAGNDSKDLDANNPHFPNPIYADGSGRAQAWIEVGASGMKDDSSLVAPFSNYGKTKVDVFAPGVDIYSTIPNDTYEGFDGTSMAAPVVAGLAALLREYYPSFSALQIKKIIMTSVIKVGHALKRPGTPAIVSSLAELCISGGVVNTYNAIRLAENIK